MLQHSSFQELFKHAGTGLLKGLEVGSRADGDRLKAVGVLNHNGVGTDLAVGKFIHEALAGGRNPQAVFSGTGLREGPADTHALFLGVVPRRALNPVVLDLSAANAARFSPEFSGSAGLVRGVEVCGKFRILHRAVGNVTGEAAVAEHNTLLCADKLHAAGTGLREAVALADLQAKNSTLFITDDVFNVGAGFDLDAKLCNLFEFLGNDAGARTVLRGDITRNAVAAFLTDCIGVVFNAQFLHGPFVVGQGRVGNQLHLFGVIHVKAGNEHVIGKEFRRILNAVLELLGAAGSGQNTAVNNGVAAGGGHLFQNHAGSTGFLGFNRGSQTCKARPHDDNVIGGIPL